MIELLVTISIIALLAALLYPAVGAVKARAKQAECLNHLRVWGLAVNRYAQEHQGKVYWKNWQSISSTERYYDEYLADSALPFYGKVRLATEKFRKCPSTTWDGQGNSPVNYAFIRPSPQEPSSSTYSLAQASQPSKLLMMIDATALNIDSSQRF